jgi:hypothetical protein
VTRPDRMRDGSLSIIEVRTDYPVPISGSALAPPRPWLEYPVEHPAAVNVADDRQFLETRIGSAEVLGAVRRRR